MIVLNNKIFGYGYGKSYTHANMNSAG